MTVRLAQRARRSRGGRSSAAPGGSRDRFRRAASSWLGSVLTWSCKDSHGTKFAVSRLLQINLLLCRQSAATSKEPSGRIALAFAVEALGHGLHGRLPTAHPARKADSHGRSRPAPLARSRAGVSPRQQA